MMKREMLLMLLAVGCLSNNALSEIEQPSEQKDDVVVEKKKEEPKVLNPGDGLHTELHGNTLYDIMNNNKGTEQDGKAMLIKYNKQRQFEQTGMLKRLTRYPKAREHIERGNAVLCPVGTIRERDPRNDFDTDLAVIVYKTQDIHMCAKVAEWHERLRNERRTNERRTNRGHREMQC